MEVLDEINGLIADNEFERAKQRLLQIIAEDGESYDKLKLLGLVNVNLGLYDEARQNFEKVITEKLDDATSWFYLGSCCDNLHLYDNAINAYKKVIELREGYLDAYKNLCVIYLHTNNETKAIELAEQAKQIDDTEYIFDYMIGTACIKLKRINDAIEHLEAVSKQKPDHAQILANLATAYSLANNQEKAIETYKKSLKIEPDCPSTLYNLGSVYQILNKHLEACVCLEKSYVLGPDERTLIALTLSELKSENYIKAIEHYKMLIIAHPEKDSYQYNLATCYEQIRDFDNAINILKKLYVRNPKSLKMAEKLAKLYLEIRDLRNAKKIFDDVLLKQSPTSDVLYQYAIISSQLYDTDTAERIFKKVIKMNPDNARAHKDLGVIYLNKRLFDYAEDEFKTALNLEPESHEMIFEYANFLYAVTKYKEADEYYAKALELKKDDVITMTLSAINKIDMNELDDARNLIDNALEIEPHHEYIQFMAGRIYYSLKDYEKAKRFLIHSIEQNPDKESKNLLALTYFELGEYESANNIFENLLKENDINIGLLYNSAQCYEKLGEKEKALEKLYKLTDFFSEHEDAQEMIRRLS